MMFSIRQYTPTIVLPALLALISASMPSHAVPVQATVLSAQNYSVIHNGATPSGSGNPNDWMWFNPGQAIVFDLTGDTVSLLSDQSFVLEDGNGNTSSLLITGLDLDLSDPTDGFSGGTLDYVLDGSTTGTFTFANQNYNSIFNSSAFDGSIIDFYIWGGDSVNGLGLDFGVSGLASVTSPGGSEVPVPGAAWLFGSALLGLTRVRRRKVSVV